MTTPELLDVWEREAQEIQEQFSRDGRGVLRAVWTTRVLRLITAVRKYRQAVTYFDREEDRMLNVVREAEALLSGDGAGEGKA